MNKFDLSFDWMRTFVRIAERGSFSAVARERGIGQPTVTRHIRDLENYLGVALLSRTTRKTTLTEEGSHYYMYCIQILRLVELAFEDSRGRRQAPAGTIRISCTSAFGVLHAAKLVFEFQDQYPDISVDLSLTDERIDLIQEGVDIALRLGHLTESCLKHRSLGSSKRLLVASPGYLAENGRPALPVDLVRYEGIRMSNVASSDMLILIKPGYDRCEIPFRGKLRVDNGLAAREALLQGRGIGVAHQWLINDLLKEKKLEVILPEYQLLPIPLNMLITPERASIVRVRMLIDFFIKRMPEIPGIEFRDNV